MAPSSLESISEKSVLKHQKKWTMRRKLTIAGVTLTVVLLAVGLGVGLGIGLHQGSHSKSTRADSSATTTPMKNLTANSTATWQPAAGVTWQYELYSPLNSTGTVGIDVWDIDLFDNDASTIKGLQAGGARVICYFSAGSYEDWRSDAKDFNSSDLGKGLDGWPDEKWLNTSSANVRNIMLARLNIAAEKNCDGVDPDNIDGYDNDNGLGLTQASAVDYMNFLAQAAQERNLSIGLKNAGAIIPDVIGIMQWSVNEQCVQFGECDTYAPFIEQGKPVFHVEYPKGDNTNNNNDVSSSEKTRICSNSDASGFSTIIKNMLLDLWLETC